MFDHFSFTRVSDVQTVLLMKQITDSAFFHDNGFIGNMPQPVCNNRASEAEDGKLSTLEVDCAGQSPRVACGAECCTACFE